ncbi:MAG TPA: hypothetical protein VG223_01385 [Solirubrobacteraceae bacterium]|nr:hypothetical protein [Solirubrobacteraceae bacterium]
MSEPPFIRVHPATATPPLLRYEANVTSDSGEDGVIAHALQVIGARDGWCCEFGAWDGRHASNTWSLIAEHGYRAVLLERDAERFAALRRTHAGRDGVIALQRTVGFDGPDRLGAILATTPIPADFDLLSIDIDGNDYHVWDALDGYYPKVVVVEYNPTIPNEIDFVQARDLHVSQGSSLSALARLGVAKGYRLIHATVVNAIFVNEAYAALFELASPAALRADLSQVTWMLQTYDGRLKFAGYDRVRWHGVALDPRRLQLVPRALRAFPPSFSPVRALVFRAWRAWRARRA